MDEQVLVCSECLADWAPEHAQHGTPIDEARWRELVGMVLDSSL